ncbi:hypothetical protein [Glaciecola petra]|uniref:Uncharacterized protein n=1 Tax=Glaciecola petra TaxID=3075602 RepID=A0ABU2ZXX2_9ALTE|nr:hypothetical protein [Aestuariibacter sp. P117]MDT0596257.1 hypothetical protein [Aestuariibacter sp. P117]
MLLRRFMKHVDDQNWFAVGLDVLVVITGIFLGLQIAEWNDGRNNRNDAQDFLVRIHGELLAAETASSRVRVRRLNLIDHLSDAVTVIFDKDAKRLLEEEHCFALATSHYYNIAISDLPSLIELMSAGRVAIIENNKLRTELIAFQQSVGTLKENISISFRVGHKLPIHHPKLIRSEPYFNETLGEIQARYVCDLEGMRLAPSFLNMASENADAYDAYLRDGLRPWSERMKSLHHLLDEILGLTHNDIK